MTQSEIMSIYIQSELWTLLWGLRIKLFYVNIFNFSEKRFLFVKKWLRRNKSHNIFYDLIMSVNINDWPSLYFFFFLDGRRV